MAKSKLLTLSLLLLLPATVVDSLNCFRCATTAESHECVDDYEGMVNTSLGVTDTYSKNCTLDNVNWTRCMISTAEANGRTTYYARGCHDGVNFSKLHDNPKFVGLPANNQTTCARMVNSRELVCFTFCDTDYCNGPQPPPTPPPTPVQNTTEPRPYNTTVTVSCFYFRGDLYCNSAGLSWTSTFPQLLLVTLHVCLGTLVVRVFF